MNFFTKFPNKANLACRPSVLAERYFALRPNACITWAEKYDIQHEAEIMIGSVSVTRRYLPNFWIVHQSMHTQREDSDRSHSPTSRRSSLLFGFVFFDDFIDDFTRRLLIA